MALSATVATAYRYLHEGLTVLADHAPDLSTALERAAAAGYTHLNLDGTVIRTDRVAAPGPNGADLWWPGKHKHHGGNVQAISAPDGWPLWVAAVRPGREHDTTCARTHGLIGALIRLATTPGIPTLTNLGYENARPGFRYPVKKPQGGELTCEQQTFNKVIHGIHGVAERANAAAQGHLQGPAQGQPRPQKHHPDRPSSPRPAPVGTRPRHLNEDHKLSRDVTEKGSLSWDNRRASQIRPSSLPRICRAAPEPCRIDVSFIQHQRPGLQSPGYALVDQ